MQLIAIAGGTCAGKSALAAALLERLPHDASIISEDDFYPDRSALTEGELESVNWDSYESIDTALFLKCLEQWLAGEPYEIPCYDKNSHARLGASRDAELRPILVAEGLHVISLVEGWVSEDKFRRDQTLRLLRVFIDCPERVRYFRRGEREQAATTISGKFNLYWRLVSQPTYLAEVRSQLDDADLILSCSFETEDIDRIFEWIQAGRDR